MSDAEDDYNRKKTRESQDGVYSNIVKLRSVKLKGLSISKYCFMANPKRRMASFNLLSTL